MTGKNWYNCRVKYQSLDESGQEIKASDDYMLDAYNYTEAETSIHKLMNERLRGSFEVLQITKTNFTDAIGEEDSEKWFRVKIANMITDDQTGKEKQATQYIAIAADDIKQAFDLTRDYMGNRGQSYLVPSISFIKVKEVFFMEKGGENDHVSHIREFLAGGAADVDPETGEIITE
jgi:hypothetical protein